MEPIKEQIMIVSIGLGMEEAHHPWSKDGYTFKAEELFDHFINVVLPLIKKTEEGRQTTNGSTTVIAISTKSCSARHNVGISGRYI